MANYKTAKNILSSRTEYSRIYGGFRGVDFSNDHTQVNDSRFAYLVNMYKDYQSGQGEAVEDAHPLIRSISSRSTVAEHSLPQPILSFLITLFSIRKVMSALFPAESIFSINIAQTPEIYAASAPLPIPSLISE